MVAHPFHFGRGETGEYDVARDRAPEGISIHRGGLRCGAGVVPQHTGAQRRARTIQQSRAMHMPAKPDALHGGQINPQPRNRIGAGGEPIARVLFDPAIVGARHLQGHHAFRDDVFGVVHQQGLQPRGAQIKPQKHGFPLCQRLCGVARLAHDDHA